MKKQTTIISILCLGLLLSLDVSAAGVRFKNNSSENIAVRIITKGIAAPEATLFIGTGAVNEYNAGIGGIERIEYMHCGALYTLSLDIPGLSGMRDYILNAAGDKIWISGVGLDPAIGDKTPTKTWNSRGTCCPTCPVCKPCTYTISGG